MIRRLSEGDRHPAVENGRHGRYLFLDIEDRAGEFPIGSLIEIEDGSMLCLGEIQQWTKSTATILVEHSLDRARLASVDEMWG